MAKKNTEPTPDEFLNSFVRKTKNGPVLTLPSHLAEKFLLTLLETTGLSCGAHAINEILEKIFGLQEFVVTFKTAVLADGTLKVKASNKEEAKKVASLLLTKGGYEDKDIYVRPNEEKFNGPLTIIDVKEESDI